MNLILFLGSGISIDSGHPNVGVLTERILNSKEHINETMFLRALSAYDEKARFVGGTYGENYRDSTSYEDLYYLCDEISLFDWGLHNNSIVPAFMEILVEEFTPFLIAKSQKGKLLEIGKYAHAAKKYIDKAVIENLFIFKEIIGLDLIIQLAKSSKITALNILTLNHDTLVEEILLKNEIEFADGFGSPDGDVRWFEPDTFLANKKVKLLKLHGSIDWYSFLDNRRERIAKITSNNSEEKKNSEKKVLELATDLPRVLSGLNKAKYYNSGMYTDIHYHFQRMLYQNNLMIMSGYGWGDDAINNRLMTWIDKVGDNKLILLHKHPELLMKRSMIMDRDYSNWIENAKLKLIPKWLSDTSLEEALTACQT